MVRDAGSIKAGPHIAVVQESRQVLVVLVHHISFPGRWEPAAGAAGRRKWANALTNHQLGCNVDPFSDGRRYQWSCSI